MPGSIDSRNIVEAILDAAVDGIITIDALGRIERFNGSTLAMFGYSRDELVGENVKLLMPPPYRAEHDSYLERYRATGEPRIIGMGRDVEGRRKDGSVFPLHLSIGEAVLAERHHYVGILHDRSTQKRLEEAQGLAADQILAIAAAAVDALATIDERGIIESANPALENLFGYARDELIGRNVKMLMPPQFREEHDGYLAAFRDTGVRRIIGLGREVEGRRKDGSVFPMYLSVSEFTLGDRRWFAGNMHDLSPQKALEEQLIQSQKMEALGGLAGGVAHDFNNLLTAILGSAEIASRHADEGTALARSIRRVKLAAERGAGLTQQLLAFSRQQVTHYERIELNAAVVAVRELFERMIGEDIEVRLDLSSDAGVVEVDPGQFDQVVINLIVNARDAMPSGGKLTLVTARDDLEPKRAVRLGLTPGPHASLSVIDTGNGIPEEVRPKIFEPFFTTKARGHGTGLGLSTVLGITKSHGGAIEVQSSSTGSKFRLVLPRCADFIGEAVAEGPDALRFAGEPASLLLVEDDELMRELLVEVLELEGHRVHAVATPDAALEFGGMESIDLVLIDVVMPQLSGFELVRQLRKRGANPRVLFMSGYTDQVLADRGELGEGDAFLRKPFANRELIEKIEEVLTAPLPDLG